MKLILTKELGRLAKWLRILGLDTVYSKEDNPGSLIIRALRDDRVIITRNHRLSKPSGIKVVLLKSERLREQIPEISRALKIRPDKKTMFNRCTICNELLAEISKPAAKDKVPEYVFQTQEAFLACPQCKRIYWPGTHWGNVARILEEIA
ncbi:MAG: Mut7-C RNAse domain-containing protein [Candidatus Omnitrophota bacterium]|jgi:hypothetical protein